MKNAIVLLAAMGLSLAPAAKATSIAFDYTTGNLGQGSGTNSIVKSSGNETVTVTAFGLTGNGNTTFQNATVGQYSGFGLGICNLSETYCSSPQHMVDDNGQLDFILFTFTQGVSSISVTLNPVGSHDTNASYLTGTNLSPLNHTLAQMGTFTASPESQMGVERTITINNLNGANSLLLGASITGSNNYFKIEAISLNTMNGVPEPSTYLLVGVALLGIGFVNRKRIKS